MPRTIAFDSCRVDWIEVRPDPETPGRLALRGYGAFVSSDTPGLEQGAEISGWAGISDQTRQAVEVAVMAGMFERCAAALELRPGAGLIVDGTTIREAREGETPDWTVPG